MFIGIATREMNHLSGGIYEGVDGSCYVKGEGLHSMWGQTHALSSRISLLNMWGQQVDI